MSHNADRPAGGAGYDRSESMAAALDAERAGYLARIDAARADGDDAAAKKLEGRVAQVDAELAGLGGGVETATEAPTPEKAAPAKKTAKPKG